MVSVNVDANCEKFSIDPLGLRYAVTVGSICVTGFGHKGVVAAVDGDSAW